MAATAIEAAALGLALIVGAGSVGTALMQGAEGLATAVGTAAGTGDNTGQPTEPVFDGNYAQYNWLQTQCEGVGGVYQASGACTAP